MLLVLHHAHADEGTRIECVSLERWLPAQGSHTYETSDGTLQLCWPTDGGVGPAEVQEAGFALVEVLRVHLRRAPHPCASTTGTVWPKASTRLYEVPSRGGGLDISNMCGSCRLLEGVVVASAFAGMFVGATPSRVVELSTIGGTLYLKRNQRELDFKGARALTTLQAVLDAAFGVPMELQLHMLVLTGSIGAYVHLGEPCLLAGRVAAWCEPHIKRNDVCDCVTLEDIRWPRMPGSSPERLRRLEASLAGVTVRAHVTRKGKLVMHLHWPASGAALEAAWLRGLVGEVGECTLGALRAALLVA